MMYSFENDYSEGAHPKILQTLKKYGFEQNTGYGLDVHCINAENKIKKLVKVPKAKVFFLPGGTIVNLTFLASVLRPYEAVIAPETGHINVHETGAIEATGHKIVTVPSHEGKLIPEDIEKAVIYHCDEHMVKPRVVFISDSTEYGTIYSKQELLAIKEVCKKYSLYLYLDGARLANALAAEGNDVSLEDLGKICDAFYIGGTKNGLLFGEALVIINQSLVDNFRFMIKQRGALTAKGFLTGIQFETILKNNLYCELGKHANTMAQKLRKGLEDKGIKMLNSSPTNQIFPILDDTKIDELKKNFNFIVMSKVNDHQHFVRLVCSWATPIQAVEDLIKAI